MSTVRIWFNHASSGLHAVLQRLREGDFGSGMHLIVSHGSRDFGARVASDHFEQESSASDGSAYVRWCLAFCRKHCIDVFVPTRRREAIADHRAEFESAGVRLVVAADGATLRLLEDKARFLNQVPASVPVPWHRVVRDVAGFRHALGELQEMGRPACFKPSRSIFGLGFHRIDANMTPMRRLLSSEPHRISADEAIAILRTSSTFPELLVMEYLDGAEFSVDVAARGGEVLAMVVRRKPFSGRVRDRRASAPRLVSGGRSQVIAAEPAIEAMVAEIVRAFGLGGLCNVQFRTAAVVPEQPMLLEVNGRMSGGLGYAALAGIDPVRVAIDAAMDRLPKRLLRPAASVRVQERPEFFIVPDMQPT